MEQQNGWKTKKKFIIGILLACLLGGASGIYYIDTYYGEGKIRTSLTKNLSQSTDNAQDKKKNSTITKESTTKKTEDTKEQTDKEKITQDPVEQMAETQGDALEIGNNSLASFATFGKNFMMCTKDGIKYFTGVEEQIWNDTFTMASPFLIQEGEFAAVGDLGGRLLGVYDKAGFKYRIQTDGSIVYFALNQNGYLGVITSHEGSYQVMIYRNDGTELKGRVEETEDIYPLSVDISDDNRVFAISYLDSSDIKPIARVLFFYINQADGEDFTDSMFAALEKPDEMIPMIGFMKNGVLAAVSDHTIYGMNLEGKEIWHRKLSNQLEFVRISKECLAVAFGKELPDEAGKTEGSLLWMDETGKKVGELAGNSRVSYFKDFQGYSVVGTRKKYFGVNHNGKIAWEYVPVGDVYDMLGLDKENKILYVTKTTAEVVDMDEFGKKGKSSLWKK